jgi:protein-L-isoaspartate(D-aspartate) O-methyltransferase
MDRETELQIVRRAYAKQILAAANVTDPAVLAAFAAVPREHYLGPGPWPIFRWLGTYTPTPDDDPVYLYTDQLVGLVPARHINNGQPSLHATLIGSTGMRAGERVVHVGAGVGYYTAIMAHIVGPTGHVTAFEFDAELAARARANLAPLANVEVVHGDGMTAALESPDVIYMNAGVTRVPLGWVDRLNDGGRVLLPLATKMSIRLATPDLDLNKVRQMMGVVFCITRAGSEFKVRWVSPVAIIPAENGGDEASAAALTEALANGNARKVTRLVLRETVPEGQRWLAGEEWCFAYG